MKPLGAGGRLLQAYDVHGLVLGSSGGDALDALRHVAGDRAGNE